jgi:hypothetical protein
MYLAQLNSRWHQEIQFSFLSGMQVSKILQPTPSSGIDIADETFALVLRTVP